MNSQHHHGNREHGQAVDNGDVVPLAALSQTRECVRAAHQACAKLYDSACDEASSRPATGRGGRWRHRALQLAAAMAIAVIGTQLWPFLPSSTSQHTAFARMLDQLPNTAVHYVRTKETPDWFVHSEHWIESERRYRDDRYSDLSGATDVTTVAANDLTVIRDGNDQRVIFMLTEYSSDHEMPAFLVQGFRAQAMQANEHLGERQIDGTRAVGYRIHNLPDRHPTDYERVMDIWMAADSNLPILIETQFVDYPNIMEVANELRKHDRRLTYYLYSLRKQGGKANTEPYIVTFSKMLDHGVGQGWIDQPLADQFYEEASVSIHGIETMRDFQWTTGFDDQLFNIEISSDWPVRRLCDEQDCDYMDALITDYLERNDTTGN